MANDVTARTEQLIQKLRQLSTEAGTSEVYLNNLEKVLNNLGGMSLGNLEKSVRVLNEFNKNLLMMTGNADAIKEVQNQFSDLGKTIAETGTKAERMKEIGRMGIETQAMNRPIGFRGTASTRIEQRMRYEQAKKEAEETQRKIKESEIIWKETEKVAQQIASTKANVLLTLSQQNVAQAANAKPSVTSQPYDYRNVTPVQQTPFYKYTSEGQQARMLAKQAEQESQRTDLSTSSTNVPEVPVISEDSLRRLGLSSAAAENFTKQLKAMGISAAEISKPITEMSTGITTVTATAKGAGDSVKTFTAHIDPMGNVLQDTQKRFRSFASAVMRDTVEVLKWTLAISMIYGPIRKMGEMLEQAKQIQLDMVDVQIALGNSTRDMQAVFEATSDIANQTSSSIEGVIEGYSLAVAAAASAGSEFQKAITTNALLRDSMILSKLANTDQKQALDTLVGALSQLGMGLTQGTQLLDSWVAVSKKANVSINQLATSFAIVGSAAGEVGLDFNELNALVGTLAQATTLSADEVGNAIRGIIAAMQTDKAQAEFAKYGIATKTLSGDFRDFMDILREMKIMQQGGILDEKAMSALTQAGGAGARRGAQLSALVQNLPTTFELITVSQEAGGEAAQAMALEMKTLDAATTRLSNSFAMLAQTLGGEGGVIGFLTTGTNMITGLVNMVRQLVSVMKGAAPALAAFALLQGVAGTATGARFLNAPLPGFLQQMLTPALGTSSKASRVYTASNLGKEGAMFGRGAVGGFAPLTNMLLTALQGTGIGTKNGQQASIGQSLSRFGQWAGQPLPYMGKLSPFSMMGPLAVMAGNIGKPLEEGLPRAAVGGGVGMALGALTGSPLWATVGSVIATGFYDEFLTFEGDIATSWSTWATNNKPPADKDKPQTREDMIAQLDKEIKNQLSVGEKFGINIQKWALNIGKTLNPKLVGNYENVGQSEALLSLYLSGGKNIFGVQELSPETMDKMSELLGQWMIEQETQGLIAGGTIPSTPLESQIISQIQSLSSFAADESAKLMQKALEDIAKGVPGSLQNYLDLQSVAQSYASVAGNLIQAETLISQTPNAPQFEQMTQPQAVQFVAGLNPEELNTVSTLLTQINSGQNTYNKLVADGKNVTADEKKALDELALSILNAKNQYLSMIPAIQQAVSNRMVETKLLNVVEIPENITPEQRKELLAGAEKLWRQVFEASGIPKNVIDDYIKNQQQQIMMANNEVVGYTQVPQGYITQQAEIMNLPMNGKPSNVNVQDLRQYSKSQEGSILGRYYQILRGMIDKFQYQPELEKIGLMYKDGTSVLDLDLKILNMAMQDLIDVTKENGLQGIYNLPEGATFMVPVSAYELDRSSRYGMSQGGGGVSPTDDLFSDYPTTPIVPQAQTRAELERSRMVEREKALSGMSNVLVPPTTTPAPQITAPPVFQTFLPMFSQLPSDIGNAVADSVSMTRAREGGTEKEIADQRPPANWLESLGKGTGKLLESVLGWFDRAVSGAAGAIGGTEQTNAPPPVTTSLNLEVDSNIQLIVDGRTLATIIKPYLYEDLIRYGATSSASSRSVIA